MDTGELVPDEIVIRVVDEHFAAGGPLEDGFILDGFPRTLVQAEELERVLHDHPLDLVLDIDVPTETILDRIAGRRVCVELRCHVPREPPPRRRLDVRRVRRARSCSATTTPRRRWRRGSRSTTARPCRSSTSTRNLGKLVVVDGVGDGDEVQERLVKEIDGRFDPVTTVITRKNPEQIALMRRAGRVVAEMHEVCIRAAKPGATTLDVDAVAREVLERRGARSNFLGYHGFPAVVCTSPNDVIVHGIPSDDVVLEEGDILSIDCGAIIEGWHADAAITVPVDEIDDESQRLIEVTRRSLEAAIDQVVEGHRLGDVGAAVEGIAEQAGFTVVREYVGHGIGTAMHEDPQVPNYGPAGRGMKLKEGHVLAIEPMVNAGTAATAVLDDGWTVVTADGRRSAHFEHTIAVTDHGPEVLTLPW